MTRAIAQTYNIANDYRAQITGFFLTLCVFMVAIYMINIYRTISGTIALESAEKQIASVSSAVGSLDAQYMEASRAATPDALNDYGLQQGKVSVYISSPAKIGRATMTGYEI
jgi:hypothetical protein